MNYLSPSILSADFGKLAEDVQIATENGAEYVHIDVMDGMFVPNISIGFTTIEGLRKYCDKVFDVHLMIQNPERYIERFAKAGSDIITIHAESTDNLKDALDLIRACGKKVGLSVKPATPISEIAEYLPILDMVLIMTVEPGFGGQKLMPDMLEKIKELYKIKVDNGYTFDIEADGGITLDNVSMLLDAGVNVVVAGSSVFKPGKTAENTVEFMKILNA